VTPLVWGDKVVYKCRTRQVASHWLHASGSNRPLLLSLLRVKLLSPSRRLERSLPAPTRGRPTREAVAKRREGNDPQGEGISQAKGHCQITLLCG